MDALADRAAAYGVGHVDCSSVLDFGRWESADRQVGSVGFGLPPLAGAGLATGSGARGAP